MVFLSYPVPRLPPASLDADDDYGSDAVTGARNAEVVAMSFDPELFFELTRSVDRNREGDSIEEARALPASWAELPGAEQVRDHLQALLGASPAHREAARARLLETLLAEAGAVGKALGNDGAGTETAHVAGVRARLRRLDPGLEEVVAGEAIAASFLRGMRGR